GRSILQDLDRRDIIRVDIIETARRHTVDDNQRIRVVDRPRTQHPDTGNTAGRTIVTDNVHTRGTALDRIRRIARRQVLDIIAPHAADAAGYIPLFLRTITYHNGILQTRRIRLHLHRYTPLPRANSDHLALITHISKGQLRAPRYHNAKITGVIRNRRPVRIDDLYRHPAKRLTGLIQHLPLYRPVRGVDGHRLGVRRRRDDHLPLPYCIGKLTPQYHPQNIGQRRIRNIQIDLTQFPEIIVVVEELVMAFLLYRAEDQAGIRLFEMQAEGLLGITSGRYL